jgi:NADH-quinone oxidoreductase subunit C
MSANELLSQLRDRFGDTLLDARLAAGEVTVEVAPADLIATAIALRDEAPFRFEQLVDVCGMDYLAYGDTEWTTEEASSTGFSRAVEANVAGRLPGLEEDLSMETPQRDRRYAAVYHLLSVNRNQRLRIKVFAPDQQLPIVPSVIDVWNGANWFEREAFDLYGIMFEGHPDLRRILTDYGFIGHPFRKDFPLSGNVEVIYDPEKQRVVYQPVSIEPRVLVPRVIRAEAQDDETAEDGEDSADDVEEKSDADA